jgi:hypothetical protein
VNSKGIQSTPHPKPGKMLEMKMMKHLREFCDDEISRHISEKRNFVCVKEHEKQSSQIKMVTSMQCE